MNKRRLLFMSSVIDKSFDEPFDPDADILAEFDSVISTKGLDRHNEVVWPEGMRNIDDFAEGNAPLPMLWEHGIQIGHSSSVQVMKSKIKTHDVLSNTETVRKEVYPLLRSGSLRTNSIGFIGHEGEEDKKGVWHWTDWSLIERSLVAAAANVEAQIIQAKSAGYPTDSMVEEVLERKELSEIELCLERIERLTGAAQGVHDIAIHWQGAGELLSALDGDSIDELAQARLHLDAVLLAYQSASEAEKSLQSIEDWKEALGK